MKLRVHAQDDGFDLLFGDRIVLRHRTACPAVVMARGYGGVDAFLEAMDRVAARDPEAVEELDAMDQQWEQIRLYDRWQKLKEAGHHHCPACHHEWPIEQDAMAGLPDWIASTPRRWRASGLLGCVLSTAR